MHCARTMSSIMMARAASAHSVLTLPVCLPMHCIVIASCNTTCVQLARRISGMQRTAKRCTDCLHACICMARLHVIHYDSCTCKTDSRHATTASAVLGNCGYIRSIADLLTLDERIVHMHGLDMHLALQLLHIAAYMSGMLHSRSWTC